MTDRIRRRPGDQNDLLITVGGPGELPGEGPGEPPGAGPGEVPGDARRVSVAAERLERWLAGFAERHGETVTTSSDEVVLLTGADGDRAWLDVPFPPLRGTLVEHVTRPRRVGVLLVRRTGYAAGIFEAATLVASKTGTAYVQGTTKAGGWSQQRYARRRANQAASAFAHAADGAATVLADATLDAFVAGGDRDGVRAVLSDRRLAHLQPEGPWLEVKDPKRKVLETMPEQFLAVRIALQP